MFMHDLEMKAALKQADVKSLFENMLCADFRNYSLADALAAQAPQRPIADSMDNKLTPLNSRRVRPNANALNALTTATVAANTKPTTAKGATPRAKQLVPAGR